MQIHQLIGQHLVDIGSVTKFDTPFVRAAIDLIHDNLEVVQDSEEAFKKIAVYPLPDLLASGKADKIKEDNLKEMCEYVLEQYASGGLREVRRCCRGCPCLRQALHLCAMQTLQVPATPLCCEAWHAHKTHAQTVA